MRKWISLLTLLLLAAVFPARASATGTYYYYYEGLRDTRTSSTWVGYYMGSSRTENWSRTATGSLFYQQTFTETRTSSLSGSVRFGAQVGNDALGMLNAQLGGAYTTSVTWTAGTTKGAAYTVSPLTAAELSAYLGQGIIQGTEVVRVEYYPAAGDPVFVQGVDDPSLSQSDGDLATVQSFPVISYQYNSFSAAYPDASGFCLVFRDWPLPPP
ncbi:MAG: hypothetical protein AB1492_05995 [Bacillota bacterium]